MQISLTLGKIQRNFKFYKFEADIDTTLINQILQAAL